jgi:hypothetical protein
MAFTVPNGGIVTFGIWTQLDETIAIMRRDYLWVGPVSGDKTTRDSDVFAAFGAGGLFAVLQPVLATPVAVLGESCVLRDNPDKFAPTYSTVVSGVGAGGSVALPSQVAGLISFGSDTLGARGEGRTYVPFPPVAGNELHGKMTAAYQSALLALGTMLLGPIPCPNTPGTGSGTLTACTKVLPVIPTTSRLFSTVRVEKAWATQRRRGDFGRVRRSPF